MPSRLKEALFGLPLVLLVLVPIGSRTLAERGADFPGVCAGIDEAASSASMLRPFVEHPWPGEVDYSGKVMGWAPLRTVATRSRSG